MQVRQSSQDRLFQFKLDKNPTVYAVTMTSDSLDVAIADINALVGATVASKGGVGQNELVLTSSLAGVGSEVPVLAGVAATAFGLSTTAVAGSGRPGTGCISG